FFSNSNSAGPALYGLLYGVGAFGFNLILCSNPRRCGGSPTGKSAGNTSANCFINRSYTICSSLVLGTSSCSMCSCAASTDLLAFMIGAAVFCTCSHSICNVVHLRLPFFIFRRTSICTGPSSHTNLGLFSLNHGIP